MVELDEARRLKLQEEQLNQSNKVAIEELQSQAREAQVYGYAYLEVSRVEKAMIALAVLNGAHQVTSLEDALDYLVYLDVKAIKENVETLEREKGVEEEAKIGFQERVEVLEEVLSEHNEADNGLLLAPKDVGEIVDVLDDARKVLTLLPGQRQLAQRAFRASSSLIESDTMLYLPVSKEELEAAFPPENTD